MGGVGRAIGVSTMFERESHVLEDALDHQSRQHGAELVGIDRGAATNLVEHAARLSDARVGRDDGSRRSSGRSGRGGLYGSIAVAIGLLVVERLVLGL